MILYNFFKFNLSPKDYLWKKKGNVDQIQLKDDKETDLSIGGKSQLKNKKTQIETELKWQQQHNKL